MDRRGHHRHRPGFFLRPTDQRVQGDYKVEYVACATLHNGYDCSGTVHMDVKHLPVRAS